MTQIKSTDHIIKYDNLKLASSSTSTLWERYQCVTNVLELVSLYKQTIPSKGQGSEQWKPTCYYNQKSRIWILFDGVPLETSYLQTDKSPESSKNTRCVRCWGSMYHVVHVGMKRSSICSPKPDLIHVSGSTKANLQLLSLDLQWSLTMNFWTDFLFLNERNSEMVVTNTIKMCTSTSMGKLYWHKRAGHK